MLNHFDPFNPRWRLAITDELPRAICRLHIVLPGDHYFQGWGTDGEPILATNDPAIVHDHPGFVVPASVGDIIRGALKPRPDHEPLVGAIREALDYERNRVDALIGTALNHPRSRTRVFNDPPRT